MKNLYRGVFVFFTWLFLVGECYSYGGTAVFCSGDGQNPAFGQILIGAYYNTLQCPSSPTNYYIVNGFQTFDNEVFYTSFLDVPVGNQLSVCSINGTQTIPPGWQSLGQDGSSTCSGLGVNWLIKHTSCVAEDTNCYPIDPTISISSNPVVVPGGQSSANVVVRWANGPENPTCVWYQMDDFTHHSPYPPTCGGTAGNATFSVQAGHQYRYWIGQQNGDTTVWAATPTVNVVQISASPSPVYVPYGTNGSTTVTWKTPTQYGNECVWVSVDGAAATSMACGGSSGTTTATWIQAGHSYKFSLYQGSGTTKLVTSTIVQGLPEVTASPSTVYVLAGTTSGSYTVSWNTPGYLQVDGYASLNGGAKFFFGTQASPGSTTNNVTVGDTIAYSFYPKGSTSVLLGTATVKALPAVSASPNPVIIPASATNANFTLSWNTPGYAQVDAYASSNGEPMHLIGSAGSPGTAQENIHVSESIQFWFYPHGSTAKLLGTVTVTGRH